MAGTKDKVVTVESLSTLHNYNKDTYITKENPTCIGSFSLNRKENTTIGEYSVAEGYNCTASGYASNAEGNDTIAYGDYQHVQGKFNIEDNSSKYAHIVGNGSSINSRSNAHTLDWDGNAWFAGDIKNDGKIIVSSNVFGDELPEAGTVGRIFFKKFTE